MIKLILQNNALSDLLILVAGIVQFFRNGTKTGQFSIFLLFLSIQSKLQCQK